MLIKRNGKCLVEDMIVCHKSTEMKLTRQGQKGMPLVTEVEAVVFIPTPPVGYGNE